MKFKVGDRVKIPSDNHHCLHCGCSGTVIRERCSDGCGNLYIQWDNDARSTHCNPEDLILIHVMDGKQYLFDFMGE